MFIERMNQKKLKKSGKEKNRRAKFKRKENFKAPSNSPQRLQRMTYEKRSLDLARSRSLAEFRDTF